LVAGLSWPLSRTHNDEPKPGDLGELVEALADWRQSFFGPLLYYPSRNMPAPLPAFVDFVRKDGVERQ